MTTHVAVVRRRSAALIALTTAAALLVVIGTTASATLVPTIPMGTLTDYAVLAATTVTNTGNTVLDGSIGVSPGSAVTGFYPPGTVTPPGRIDTANPAAAQAQSDLTSAYGLAAGRPVETTTGVELGTLVLQPGVYAGLDKSPLEITGPLVLDGAGDVRSVFIFQTDSTLVTASGSTVSLINGAQECNVFWQVGSSATLGTYSIFAGNILAQTSITVTTGVVVHGRALARGGAVTLDSNTFTNPTCAQAPTTTTTTEESGAATTTTTSAPAATTTTSAPAATTTTSAPAATTTTAVPAIVANTTTAVPALVTTTTTAAAATTTTTPALTRTVAGPTTTIAAGAAPPTTAGATTTTQAGVATTSTNAGVTTTAPTRGPGIPGIVGPPRTGGAPLPSGGLPWPAVLVASLLAVAATAGTALRRAH